MAKCSVCGSDEDLAAPFIDGTCLGCHRKKTLAENPEERERMLRRKAAGYAEYQSRDQSPRWTGSQFIGLAGLLVIVSMVAGVVTQLFGEVGGEYGMGGYSVLGGLAGLGSCALLVWAGIMFMVGIIRLGARG